MILGEAAALASAALWAGASVLFGIEGRTTRPIVMNLVKSLGACGLFLVALLLTPAGEFVRPAGDLVLPLRPIAWLALSGVVGIALGDTAFFIAMARLGVRRAMMLGLLAPVFAAAGAALVGQPLPGIVGATGIAVTLGGLLLFIRVAPLKEEGSAPRSARALGFGVLAALCQALGIVMTKGAIAQTGLLPASIVRLLAGAGALLALEVMRGRAHGLTRELGRGFRRARLLLAAFLGTFIAFYLFQAAIHYGSPPVTAALTATSPLLAVPLASRYLGERMPIAALLATLVAVAGVVLVAID